MQQSRLLLSVALALALSGTQVRASQATPQIEIDVVYGHKAGMALTMDVYRPAVPTGAAVLFINDGGFISPAVSFLEGDPRNPQLIAASEQRFPVGPHQLLERGIAFFDVRHGSAPWFDLADIGADLRAAIEFVKSEAARFGVDPERIGLLGASSGGVMALYLSGSAALFGNDSTQVAAVVSLQAVDDFAEFARSWPRLTDRIPSLLEAGPGEASNFSPGRFVSPDSPPTLIFHGDQDETAPFEGGLAFYNHLLRVGATAHFIRVEGAGHIFRGADAAMVGREALDWFVRYLVGPP